MSFLATADALVSKAHENIVTLFTTAVVVATCLIVSRRRRSKQAKKTWNMVPGSLPLVGHAHMISSLGLFDQRLQEWVDEYGDTDVGCLEVAIPQPCLLLFNEERVREVLKHRPRLIHRPTFVAESVGSIGANGVFSAEGSAWTQERKLVSAALNEKNLKDYLGVFKFVLNRLITKWKNECANPISIDQDLVRTMADAIAQVSMGRDYDFLNHPDTQVSKDIKASAEAFNFRALVKIPYWKIPFIGQYIDGYGWSIKRVQHLINRAIDEEMQGVDSEKQPTFLHKLFAVMSSERSPLARDRVSGNILTLFFAGTETTSSSLLVALYLLAKDKALQQDLWREVRDCDLDKIELSPLINGMPLVMSFLHEVHRWYGTFIIGLQANEDIPFCNTIAPKGTQFIVMNRYMTISPKAKATGVPVGPMNKPSHEFCARRWLVQEADGSWTCSSPGITNLSSMSFGYGVRSCPGRAYTEALSVLAIARVLQSFDFSLPPGHPEAKFISAITMVPDCDVRIVMEPRDG